MTDPLVLVPTEPDALLLEACAGLRLLELYQQDDPDAALAEHGKEVTAVANPGKGPLGAELLDRLPNLEVVSHFGVGYETVDVGAAVERGVVVTVLLPHVGSASLPTRRDMAALGARNLTSWFESRTVLTPVPEPRELAGRAGPDRTGG